jgi:hypothetical protein
MWLPWIRGAPCAVRSLPGTAMLPLPAAASPMLGLLPPVANWPEAAPQLQPLHQAIPRAARGAPSSALLLLVPAEPAEAKVAGPSAAPHVEPAQAPAQEREAKATGKEREVKLAPPAVCLGCGTGPGFLGCPRLPCPQGPHHATNRHCRYAHALVDASPAAILRRVVDHSLMLGGPGFIRFSRCPGSVFVWQAIVAAWHGRDGQLHRRKLPTVDALLDGTGLAVFCLADDTGVWYVGYPPPGSRRPLDKEGKAAAKAARDPAKKS